MKSLTIHLIRHGATAANTQGQYVGITDLPLTMESADRLEALQRDNIYPKVEQVYAGPLKRCSQTGILIYPDNAIIPVPNLTEYNFGDFEGKTGAELEDDENYKAWIGGKLESPPNGETTKEFTIRICMGLRQVVEDMLSHNMTTAAIITHGGVIMSLLDACGLPRRQKFGWMCDCGRGFTIKVTPSLYHSSGVVEVIDVI